MWFLCIKYCSFDFKDTKYKYFLNLEGLLKIAFILWCNFVIYQQNMARLTISFMKMSYNEHGKKLVKHKRTI